MTLPNCSVKRHVLAWMMSAVLVLVGVIGYQRVRHGPLPVHRISGHFDHHGLKGANPDIVDSSITNVIESAVNNSVPASSTSSPPHRPGLDGRTSPSPSKRRWTWPSTRSSPRSIRCCAACPRNVDPPVIAKVETNAQPIMWLGPAGRPHPAATQPVRPQRAQEAPEDHRRRRRGTPRWASRPHHPGQPGPDRMAAHAITAQTSATPLPGSMQLAGGFVSARKPESLASSSRPRFHPGRRTPGPRRLRNWRRSPGDVAEIEDGLTRQPPDGPLQRQPTIGLGMVKIANANTVAITERILARMDKELLPACRRA